MKKLLAALILLIGLLIPIFAVLPSTPAYAEGKGSVELTDEDCAILSCGEANDENGGGIFYILKIIVDILTFGVGTAATIGFVIAGIQYATAKDNTGQIEKSKARMFNIVIGLAIYALFWAAVKFLLPGNFGK